MPGRMQQHTWGEIRVKDGAHEFRVTITGKFVATCVQDVEMRWKSVLSEAASRRFTVDISRMSGFDLPGRKLLRAMYHHGVVFAASTPLSLNFLHEISAPRRRQVTMMPEATEAPAEVNSKSSNQEAAAKPFLAPRAARSGK